jgi:uncharacterized membrane protein YczE
VTADHLARFARCSGGLTVFGVGIALIITSHLGNGPWDVFHQGVAERTGVPIGTVIIATGAVLLLAWIPLRQRIGLGTVLNVVLIGAAVDLAMLVLPDGFDALAARLAAFAGGMALIAVGSGLYIGAGLGSGPRDGIMVGLAARGLSVRAARTGVEVAALAIGWILGGTVGVGTVVFALAIGPMVQVTLRWFSRPAAVVAAG